MGNCCDTVESHLTELNFYDDISSTMAYSYDQSSKMIYNHDRSNSDNLYVKDPYDEKIRKKYLKYRKNNSKLNTIIEDRQEDSSTPLFFYHKKNN